MRCRKLISVLVCALALAPAAGVLGQTPAPAARPTIRVRPEIAIAPEVRVDIPFLPDIRIALPEIAIAPLPPINVDMPDIDIDGPDIWFNDEQGEREELKQSYPLAAGARIELTNIDGPIRIEPVGGGQAEVRIISYLYGANTRKLTVESANNSLAVRGPETSVRDYAGTRHSVTLKVPRRSELTINNTHDSVTIGDMDGSVRLQGVSGNVSVAQATGSADIAHVSGSVVLNLARLSGPGVRVQDVSGKVSVRFMDELNADLQTTNIKGKVYVDVPNVAVQGEMNRADLRAKVGTGGATIAISDVTGTVRLAHGRSVAELIGSLKAGERASSRMETTRDLAMHASQPQARAALVEALQTEQNGVVEMTAARALAPYANESEVRAVFVKAVDTSKNDVARTTAMRALARNYAGDRSVRDLLLRALATDKSNLVRQTAIGALTKDVADRDVQRAFMEALKHDTSDLVRMRAAGALAQQADDAEVYALLVETAKSDRKNGVRARALDGLSTQLRAHPDLRPLFLGYLDDESISLQYHALSGLVGLNDPALKQRLVDKSRELILLNGRRYWNDQLVLDALILLRKLDAQEADRALEQLSTDRARVMHF